MNVFATATATVVILAAASAQALPVVVDDFDDGSTTGWTVESPSVSEGGGYLTGTDESLATMDGLVANTIGVDADAADNGGTNYVALVLNFTSLFDNLFVKIQDGDGNGLFDTVYFYHGNNGLPVNGGPDGEDGLSGTDFFDLSSEVATTYFQVTDHGDGTVSAFVQATGDTFGGTLSNAYAGTAVGLGFFNSGKAANFYVPEPTTLTLLGLGLIALGWRRPSR